MSNKQNIKLFIMIMSKEISMPMAWLSLIEHSLKLSIVFNLKTIQLLNLCNLKMGILFGKDNGFMMTNRVVLSLFIRRK